MPLVEGVVRGEPLEVEWDDGILIAPFAFHDSVGKLIVFWRRIALTPEGPSVPARLDDVVSAYYTICEWFDAFPAVRGASPTSAACTGTWTSDAHRSSRRRRHGNANVLYARCTRGLRFAGSTDRLGDM